LTYGIEVRSDVTAKNIRFDKFGETVFTLHLPDDEAEVLFPLNGRHNIMNALAAAAVGYSFGMTAKEIAAGLRTVAPPPQRGEILRFAAGFTVVNDSYNSNPDALVSMAQTIVDGGGNAKRKIVVAGEMLELGADAEKFHYETGARLANIGIDGLFGVRDLAKELIRGARENGLRETRFFEDSGQAGDFLTNEVREGDLVLIKGSRGVRTEKVVEKLLEKFELEK
jgi:UDP-N-acetylmuramoyl-tripeptide--D-alanyl-D-alanine ligase